MSNVRLLAAVVGLFGLLGLSGILASCQTAPSGAPENGQAAEQPIAASPDEAGDAAAGDEGSQAEQAVAQGGDELAEGSAAAASGDDQPSLGPGAQTTEYEVLPPDSVTLDASTLSPDAELVCVARPELPVDASASPTLDGIPAHVRCTWGVEGAGAGLPPSDPTPQLLVIPIGPYMASYAALGLPAIDQQLALHTMLAIEQPENPGVAVPLLPPATGPGPSIAVHPRHMRLTGGSGLRYVGHDGPPPVGDDAVQGLFYTYQGLTSDGESWVAFFHPVTAGTTLEASANELAALEADPEAYFAVVTEALAALDPDAGFAPSLTELDRVVESLAIAAP